MLNQRERVFARLGHQKVDKVPNLNIVMAFAAKQIKKPYRDYVRDYHVLVDGNLKCCEAFGIDMVSAISDPTREVHDLGGEVLFPADDVPYTGRPLLLERNLLSLKPVEPSAGQRMFDRLRAIDLYKRVASNDYPILGWVEGPMALAANLRTPVRIMEDLFEAPDFVHELLEFCLEQESMFALKQVSAGADFIGIGDAVCSLIGPRLFQKFALPYEKRLIDVIHDAGAKVKLHICGDTSAILPMMVSTGADIVDVDWMVDFSRAVEISKGETSICGNFDPVGVMLRGTTEKVATAVLGCLKASSDNSIIAAGCEIPAATPLENMREVDRVLKGLH